MKRSEAIYLRSVVEQAAQSLPDDVALTAKILYPAFDSIIGMKVAQGFKFTYADKLWSVIQPSLTIQSHYPPGAGTESLYTEICETHAGTLDDPIPYSGNMTLELGKYYMQDYTIYKCIRATVNPVYHNLPDLVGLYVEEVTT